MPEVVNDYATLKSLEQAARESPDGRAILQRADFVLEVRVDGGRLEYFLSRDAVPRNIALSMLA